MVFNVDIYKLPMSLNVRVLFVLLCIFHCNRRSEDDGCKCSLALSCSVSAVVFFFSLTHLNVHIGDITYMCHK